MDSGLDDRFLTKSLWKAGPGLLSTSPEMSSRRVTATDDTELQHRGRKGRPVRDHSNISVMWRSVKFKRPENGCKYRSSSSGVQNFY